MHATLQKMDYDAKSEPLYLTNTHGLHILEKNMLITTRQNKHLKGLYMLLPKKDIQN
jgi:hypothetical protein